VSNVPYSKIKGPFGRLARLEPFDHGGTMSADTNGSAPMGLGYVTPAGREPADVKEAFRKDRDEVGLIYVVWSYGTVIAWVTTGGNIVIPDAKYSVTTSKQQGMVRAWLGHDTPLNAADPYLGRI
jgi:hypothetical protein